MLGWLAAHSGPYEIHANVADTAGRAYALSATFAFGSHPLTVQLEYPSGFAPGKARAFVHLRETASGASLWAPVDEHGAVHFAHVPSGKYLILTDGYDAAKSYYLGEASAVVPGGASVTRLPVRIVKAPAHMSVRSTVRTTNGAEAPALETPQGTVVPGPRSDPADVLTPLPIEAHPTKYLALMLRVTEQGIAKPIYITEVTESQPLPVPKPGEIRKAKDWNAQGSVSVQGYVILKVSDSKGHVLYEAAKRISFQPWAGSQRRVKEPHVTFTFPSEGAFTVDVTTWSPAAQIFDVEYLFTG